MNPTRPPLDPNTPDGEHDAWLREALRHAPDAALSPPALLRDSILSQARAAVEPMPLAAAPMRRRPALTSAFAAFWSWLAQPPVAAGFAGVMAATLVGLMWWDRPMDEAMPQPPSPVVAARSEPVDATPGSTTTPMDAAAAPPRATVAQRATPPAAELRENSMAPDAASGRRAPLPFPSEAKPERSDDKVDDRDVSKKDAQRLTRDMTDDIAAKARAQGRATQAPPAAAPVAAAPAAVTQAEATAARLERQGVVGKPQGSLAPQAVPAPLSPLLAQLNTDPSHGTRIGNDGRRAAVDDDLLRWLAALDIATRGRWLALDAAADRAAIGLDLRVDGQAAMTLSIEATTVTLSTHAGAAPRLWRADVGVPVADRLRDSLPRLPP